MNWLIDLIKGNRLTAGAFALGLAIGGWVLYAELCHAQAREDHRTVEELVQIQRDAAREKEAEAKQQKALREFQLAECIKGTLKNVDICAKVGVKIE
jgi:hypothetical protein